MASTREHLIEKTCELLELQGYHATGLNQIVKESGSPKGVLYYHFPGGKEELAAQAVETVGEIVLERIRSNLAEIDDASESIRSFIQNIAFNVEQSGYAKGGPITTIALETASTNSRLREICDRIYQEWQDAFAQKLVLAGLPPERAASLATVIIASIEGGVILCRTRRNRQPLERVAEEISYLVTNLA